MFSMFVFIIVKPALFIESTSPKVLIVITPVAILLKILSLKFFAFVMSLKRAALSIATAA